MKKIISFLLVISFILAVAAFLPINQSRAEANSESLASQAGLEKILSPQHINLYEKIKKIGNSLWGIKKNGKLQEKLEKISTPNDIPLFEKIKKSGNALWGVRKIALYRVVSAESATCVIAAIEIKDKALTDNNTGSVAKLNSAIVARTACQKTALATTENQKTALDECVRAFKAARKQISDQAKSAHENILKTYRASLKACATAASATASSTAVSAAQEFNIDDGGGNIVDASEN